MTSRRQDTPQERFDVTFYSPWIGPLIAPGTDAPPGGAETQIFMLAKALAARGRRVCIVSYGAAGELPTEVDGIRIVTQRRVGSGRWRPLVNVSSLVRTLGGIRTDVIVQRVAGVETGFVALIARVKRARFVYSTANVVEFDLRRLLARWRVWFFHLGFRLADAIVVQTPEQAELCRARFGRSPALIKSVAEPAAQRSCRPDAFLWVARLAEYKRPDAFIELARRVPDAAFRMIAVPTGGFGVELQDGIELACAELDNIELLDPRPRRELAQLIDSAVAVVNTAEYEGMPNVFLEGWARGVPALALAHDPDGVIERERIGLFAAGSMDRFAELAGELWRTRDDQRAIAARCRDYVAREHSLGAVVDRWSRVLAPV